MQITDYSHLNLTSPAKINRLSLEAIAATLLFLVPALLLFVLSAN